ncbi:hypothetical protein BHM03_00045201, partial [Ensete ventricosum]
NKGKGKKKKKKKKTRRRHQIQGTAGEEKEGSPGVGMAEGEKRGERGEESVKLFVGQVPKHMTEEELMDLFKEVALVDEVSIIKDKVTKAFSAILIETCFAFASQASSPMQVKYADGEPERLGCCNSFYDLWFEIISPHPEHKLFIGMLPKNISDTEVAVLFSKYGTITDLLILRGSQQISKGTLWPYNA